MGCHRYEEALSARVDGEDLGMAEEALDRHVAGCARCRRWAAEGAAITGRLRVRPAEAVPDLTQSILAALSVEREALTGVSRGVGAEVRAGSSGPVNVISGPVNAGVAVGVGAGAFGGGPPSPGGLAPVMDATYPGAAGARPWWRRPGYTVGARRPISTAVPITLGMVRLALALFATAQAARSLPALLGNDLGASVHVAHEQGAWGLAVAAGLALVAWRPARAAPVAPMLAVFVACLAVLGLDDVAAARAVPSAELPHVISAFGLALVWLASHLPTGLGTGVRRGGERGGPAGDVWCPPPGAGRLGPAPW